MIIDRKKLLSILEMLLIFSSFYLSGIFISTGSIKMPDFDFPQYMMQYILTAIPQILLVIYIIYMRKEVPLKSYGITVPGIKDIGFGILAAAGLFIIYFIIISIVLLLPEVFKNILQANIFFDLRGPKNIPLLIGFCLVIGYREELFFRAYLLVNLKKLQVPLFPALIFSSLLFGSLHLYEGILGIIVTSILGLYFGVIFVKTQNFHIISISHAIFNAAIIIISNTQLPIPQ